MYTGEGFSLFLDASEMGDVKALITHQMSESKEINSLLLSQKEKCRIFNLVLDPELRWQVSVKAFCLTSWTWAPRRAAVLCTCVSTEAVVAAEVAELEVKTRIWRGVGSCDSSKSIQDICGGGGGQHSSICMKAIFSPHRTKAERTNALPKRPAALTPGEGCESLKMWLSLLYMVTDSGKGRHYFEGIESSEAGGHFMLFPH